MPQDGSPILYANADYTIILLDIPISIAAAQDLSGRAKSQHLLSCAPLETPYTSIEPKSAAALEQILYQGADDQLHLQYCNLARDALSNIKENLSAEQNFCLPRVVTPWLVGQAQKRKAGYLGDEKLGKGHSNSLKDARKSGIDLRRNRVETRLNASNVAKAITLDSENHVTITKSLPNQAPVTIPDDITYTLPPRSAFILGSIAHVASFRQLARSMVPSISDQPNTRGRFDFILLDPPWPNRSASRKASYATAPTDMRSLTKELLRMDLDMHILPGGYVAVWVTNKTACRELVLNEGGLFDAWGVHLTEEWLWVKVTRRGDPVTDLDGRWRKPYEVVLIGKAGQLEGQPLLAGGQEEVKLIPELKRRVIVGVPDLHSRKPCLKSLVEMLLLHDGQKTGYKALEVFARYCVAGWVSWGDEVILFNRASSWSN